MELILGEPEPGFTTATRVYLPDPPIAVGGKSARFPHIWARGVRAPCSAHIGSCIDGSGRGGPAGRIHTGGLSRSRP